MHSKGSRVCVGHIQCVQRLSQRAMRRSQPALLHHLHHRPGSAVVGPPQEAAHLAGIARILQVHAAQQLLQVVRSAVPPLCCCQNCLRPSMVGKKRA